MADDTPDETTAGQDSREAGKGPTDIPEESASSESELSLSEHAAKLEREGRAGN